MKTRLGKYKGKQMNYVVMEKGDSLGEAVFSDIMKIYDMPELNYNDCNYFHAMIGYNNEALVVNDPMLFFQVLFHMDNFPAKKWLIVNSKRKGFRVVVTLNKFALKNIRKKVAQYPTSSLRNKKRGGYNHTEECYAG